MPLRSLHNTKSISLLTSPLSCIQECNFLSCMCTRTCLFQSWTDISSINTPTTSSSVSNISAPTVSPSPLRNIYGSQYLRQPAVLVRDVSHSRWRGLQLSSPPSLALSQPECGTITSSDSAWSAWSTISIFTESCDDRFHRVPRKGRATSCYICNFITNDFAITEGPPSVYL